MGIIHGQLPKGRKLKKKTLPRANLWAADFVESGLRTGGGIDEGARGAVAAGAADEIPGGVGEIVLVEQKNGRAARGLDPDGELSGAADGIEEDQRRGWRAL